VGIFDGLGALQQLSLFVNWLEGLSPGTFAGLSALTELSLEWNNRDNRPLPVAVSLSPVGRNGEVRATIPAAAPFAFEVPLRVTNGRIDGCAAFTQGSVGSSIFRVAPDLASPGPVSVDIGALPDLPPGHSGYVLTKDPALPLQLPDPVHTLPLITPASDGTWRSFVRIINRSPRAGTVRISAIDDTGQRFGPVFLSLKADAAVQFNSGDLEAGAAHKGLSGGVGEGEGSWRLELDADIDIEPLAYIRAANGFVTGMHHVVAEEGESTRYGVPAFNPGSNRSVQSRLRLINPGEVRAEVVIRGRDARGEWAPEGEVRLVLPAGGARMLSAQELEDGGAGFDGRLGDGKGKWRLSVSADRELQVMSLLRKSRTEKLTNLSSTAPDPGGACEQARSGHRRVGGALSPATRKVARAASPEREGVSPRPPLALEIVLPALDPAGETSTANTGERTLPTQIGVHRAVPDEFRGDLSPRLDWFPNDDGTFVSAVWVTSPEAAAMRVGIRADLASGGEIRFFGVHAVRHRRFPVLTRADFEQEGERSEILWSPVVTGDTLGMEISLPSREARSDFSLRVERLSHIHAPVVAPGHASVPHLDARTGKSHNDAHIDVQCRAGRFPADLDSAVAVVVYESRHGFSAGCTGTLLNDRDEASFIPYFLTAEHCVGTEAEARSTEFWWFFQAAACGSDAIDHRHQVTRGGADLLASAPHIDMALLRLRQPPPGGVWYSGWSALPVLVPREVYGIHHPLLQRKSYLAGTVNRDPHRNVIVVRNDEGSILSGSSGSGLFDGEYVIGTDTSAWTSTDSSGNEISFGSYGYFTRFYPQVRRWLDTNPAWSDHAIPLVTSAANGVQQGLVRIINRSERAGTVRIHAIDDTGRRFGPVLLSLEAGAATQFNSHDLESGAPHKGLSGGVGSGEGSWRLTLSTDLDIESLAFIRTRDGVVTSIHDVAAEHEGSMSYLVPIFYPGNNRSRQGWLRLINPGGSNAEVVIRGRDSRGGWAPGGEVRLTLPAGGARVLSAWELERGGTGFDGRLGDGTGNWRLHVSADHPLLVMGLLQSSAGHLTNLSR